LLLLVETVPLLVVKSAVELLLLVDKTPVEVLESLLGQ